MPIRRRRPPIPRGLANLPHPGDTALNRLAHRQLADALSYVAARHAHGRLVDIGCGRKPYQDLFAPFVTAHIGVDHPESPHIGDAVDVTASAYNIPLETASFDTVLMSEVLEHLEEPAAALSEAARLLRPGGKIILTAPLVWVLHEEPRDYYRYTPHGLTYLLVSTGFADISVLPIGGQWATISILMGYALRPCARGPLQGPVEMLIGILHRAAVALDRMHFMADGAYGHVAVASKA